MYKIALVKKKNVLQSSGNLKQNEKPVLWKALK